MDQIAAQAQSVGARSIADDVRILKCEQQGLTIDFFPAIVAGQKEPTWHFDIKALFCCSPPKTPNCRLWNKTAGQQFTSTSRQNDTGVLASAPISACFKGASISVKNNLSWSLADGCGCAESH